MDFTNARTTAEIIQTVEEIKKTVASQQPHSIMALLLRGVQVWILFIPSPPRDIAPQLLSPSYSPRLIP